MKGFVRFIIVTILVLGVAGCGTQQDSASGTKKAAETAEPATTKEAPDSGKTGAENTKQVQPETTSNQDSQKDTAPVTKPSSTDGGTNLTAKSSTPAKPSAPASRAPSTPSKTTVTTPPPAKPAETATVSIVGPKEVKDRTILAATKTPIKDGDTVFSVLKRVAENHHIYVDAQGSGATTYVQGISDDDKNNPKWSYYEFDYGGKSGWVFKVNGVSLSKSIGIVNVKAGDRIECLYTE